MRPRSLDEFVGQEHLLAPGKPLRLAIEHDDPTSMIFWGPPGTGKTTLAKIIATLTNATFIEFSAVMSGIKEIKQVMVSAEKAADFRSRTILFVDEIHRFNKAQQDAFLPYVERGAIRLIGATTENPSFELNAALLSRCRVYTLQPLTEADIITLLNRALGDSVRGLGTSGIQADDDALATIASYASGDARNALNALDVAATWLRSNQIIGSPRKLPPKHSSAAFCCTTSTASSITTSSPLCTRASATLTRMPHSTGWAACCRQAKTPCTLPAAWSGWPSRTSVSQRPRRSISASPPATRCTFSDRLKGNSHWPRRSFISRSLQNRTPCIPPTEPSPPTSKPQPPSLCRCTCATLQPN